MTTHLYNHEGVAEDDDIITDMEELADVNCPTCNHNVRV